MDFPHDFFIGARITTYSIFFILNGQWVILLETLDQLRFVATWSVDRRLQPQLWLDL